MVVLVVLVVLVVVRVVVSVAVVVAPPVAAAALFLLLPNSLLSNLPSVCPEPPGKNSTTSAQGAHVILECILGSSPVGAPNNPRSNNGWC